MSVFLGTLVLGMSFLAWRTHATPFKRHADRDQPGGPDGVR